MFSSEGMSAADYAALSNNNAWGDGSMLWWILIIFFIAFGFGGNGFGNTSSGSAENYTLASDFATLQRQIDSATSNTQTLINNNDDQLQRQITSVANGISSLGYDQLNQMNNINSNISNATNTLSSQLASCCCTNRYEGLQNANATQNLITNGFATTNYNDATNTCAIKTQVGETGTALATQLASSTRDVVDSNNAGVQAILAKLNEQEMNAKQAQIDALTQQVNALTLAASQQAQNATLINALNPSAIPAYIVQAPGTSYTCGCSCS